MFSYFNITRGNEIVLILSMILVLVGKGYIRLMCISFVLVYYFLALSSYAKRYAKALAPRRPLGQL